MSNQGETTTGKCRCGRNFLLLFVAYLVFMFIVGFAARPLSTYLEGLLGIEEVTRDSIMLPLIALAGGIFGACAAKLLCRKSYIDQLLWQDRQWWHRALHWAFAIASLVALSVFMIKKDVMSLAVFVVLFQLTLFGGLQKVVAKVVKELLEREHPGALAADKGLDGK